MSAAQCGRDDRIVEEVRLGEWKVKDVDQFDQTHCRYFNEDQKEDCETHYLCGSNCTYENPLKNLLDCETCPEVQDIKVATVWKHPNFTIRKDGIPDNDIMLIKLSTPAVYNRLVRPVCLPPASFDSLLGEEGHSPGFFKHGNVVAGWGSTQTYRGDFGIGVPQKLITPLLSNEECIESFERLGLRFGSISVEGHLCAGGEIDKGSCTGDAGGPLMGREKPADPYTLIGVVSLGTSKCEIGAPTIYTRVSHYRNWILIHMWNDSD